MIFISKITSSTFRRTLQLLNMHHSVAKFSCERFSSWEDMDSHFLRRFLRTFTVALTWKRHPFFSPFHITLWLTLTSLVAKGLLVQKTITGGEGSCTTNNNTIKTDHKMTHLSKGKTPVRLHSVECGHDLRRFVNGKKKRESYLFLHDTFSWIVI